MNLEKANFDRNLDLDENLDLTESEVVPMRRASSGTSICEISRIRIRSPAEVH